MKEVSKKILKLLINKHRVISFDVFDTLIKRNCSKPTDIFDICEVLYNNTHNKKISNFKTIRIEAEEKCRNSSVYDEITLDEIYSYIDCKDLKKDEMKSIEIQNELNYCVPNKEFKEIYDYCIENKKRIIIVSDMYLDENTIKKILEKNGYNKGILYLSSVYRKTKYHGDIFKIIINKEKISPRKILHIGDSKRADFFSPVCNGIRAFKINKISKKTSYISPMNDSLNNNVLYSLINNNVYKMSQCEKIGYELLGPICYSFCNWLHRTACQLNIKKLFFCARDMKVIQDMYNYMYEKNAIENEYFYVSRKSMRYPYLFINNDIDSFISLIPDQKMNIKDIINMFGLNIDDEVIEKYGLLNECFDRNGLKSNHKFKDFYNAILSDSIKNNKQIKEQYDGFVNYLKNIGFDENSAIVDLGWMGTIQYSMQKVLNHQIQGLYFALGSNIFNELKGYTNAFLFDENSKRDIEEKVYTFRPLIEMLFASQHGTTLRYLNNKKFYELGEPNNNESIVLNEIQSSAKKFVYDFKKYNFDLLDIEIIMDKFINIGINPNYSESVLFGNLLFDNYKSYYLAKPKSIFYYIVKPRMLKTDFALSEWKIGFLKRLLKIKLPYFKIYKIYKKNKK